MTARYRVKFSDQALKKLKKLDRPIATLIIGYITKNLENCEDPRRMGKPLQANHLEKWRYRAGDYRILAMILDHEIQIAVIEMGHRRDIYE